MNVYENILQIIKTYGVQRLYAVPGDAINPLVEAIRHDEQMELIHVTHEEGGALAASCAAKLTGKLQVCASTVGPGAIHLLNGLYDAKMDGAPVLALLGQVATENLGTGYHQEVNLPGLFDDVAEYVTEVRNPQQLPHIIMQACQHAVSRGGVSVLVLPHDVAIQSVPDLPTGKFDTQDMGRLSAPSHLLDDVVMMLEKADRPCLFVGEGTREASGLLERLAEHLGAPMIHSLRAVDLLAHDHPALAGGLGLLGSRGGVVAMDHCDLLIMLGTDFPYRQWFSLDCDVIQVDRRGHVLGRRRPGLLGIQADVKGFVTWLLEHTPRRQPDNAYLAKVRDTREAWDNLMRKQESLERSADMLHPQGVVRMVGELADAMGGRGFRVTQPDTLKETLRVALAHNGPVIVDAVVHPNEITWPPKIAFGQAMGFGLAKIRELFCCDTSET